MATVDGQPLATPRPKRLHRSTWAWLICTLALLVIAILPGSRGQPVWRYQLIEHGWPFTYVVRDAHPWYNPSLWAAASQVVDFYPLSLLADLLIGAAILVAIGFWRERRARLRATSQRRRWQFSVRRLLLLTTISGFIIAIGVETMRYLDARRLQPYETLLGPPFLRPLLTVGERFGLHLHARYRPYEPPDDDRDLARLQYLMQRYPDTIALSINSWSTSPLDAEQLKQLARLRTRILALRDAHPETLEVVGQQDQVEWLYASRKKHASAELDAAIDRLVASPRNARLRGVFLIGKKFDDVELARIATASRLEQLQLTWSPQGWDKWGSWFPDPDHALLRHYGQPDCPRGPVSDIGLRSLANLKLLEKLRLEGTQIRGPGLAHLHNLPRLRHLTIENAPLDDAGVAYLNGCQALISLDLIDTDVASLAALHWESLPSLRRINLSGTKVALAEIRRLRREHPQILIQHDFLDWVVDLYQKHRKLSCTVPPSTPEQQRFLEQCHDLTAIHWWRSIRMADADLACIRQLEQLQRLDLSNCSIGDGAVGHIAAMTSLTRLALDGTRVTSDGFQLLAYHPLLEHITIDTAIVDPTLIEALQTMPNLQYVWLVDHTSFENAQQTAAALRAKLPWIGAGPE